MSYACPMTPGHTYDPERRIAPTFPPHMIGSVSAHEGNSTESVLNAVASRETRILYVCTRLGRAQLSLMVSRHERVLRLSLKT